MFRFCLLWNIWEIKQDDLLISYEVSQRTLCGPLTSKQVRLFKHQFLCHAWEQLIKFDVKMVKKIMNCLSIIWSFPDNLLTSNLIRKAFLIFEEGHYENIDDVIDAKGWLQTFRDPKVIDTVVQSAIEENEKQVRRYLRGKEKSFEYISQSIFDKALDVDMMLVQSVLRKRLDLLKSQSQSGSK